MTPLEISLKMLPAIIAILSLMLVFYVGKTYHPMTALHRTYIRIDGILHEKKFLFDYEETRRFLQSHGAAEHFGPWVDPVKYLAIRICLAAIGFTVGIYVNAFLGLVGMGLGFFLPPLLLLFLSCIYLLSTRGTSVYYVFFIFREKTSEELKQSSFAL